MLSRLSLPFSAGQRLLFAVSVLYLSDVMVETLAAGGSGFVFDKFGAVRVFAKKPITH